jgi:hypothetical protein
MTKDIEALVLNPNYTTGQTWKVARGPDAVGGVGDIYVVADELKVTEEGCLVFLVNGIPEVISPQSQPDRSWMWTITARDYPRTIHSRGYSATREEAMADFKKQWLPAQHL